MSNENIQPEWKPLQAIRTNFCINDIIKPEFLDVFKKSFDTEKVDVINLAIYIENSDKEAKSEIITLAHKTTDDTKEKRVIVDVNKSLFYEKVKEAFENYKG